MKLSDEQIGLIVHAEEKAALGYEGELSKKRAKNMNYYNCQPYGDEVEGQSSAVTSDVSDVIEWMLPSLIRIFTQGKLIARFESSRTQDDDEAKEKTHLSNYVFMHENNGVLTLHNMFKDALLQYTGTVKVCWEEEEEVSTTKYSGLSEPEYQALISDQSVKSVEEVEVYDSEFGPIYECEGVRVEKRGQIKYYNIPPEEFLISKTDRDFDDPVFIGHRSPKRRSDLMGMGFSKEVIESLPADEYYEASLQKNARYHDYQYQDSNPSIHSPNDLIYLGEYYIQIDVDGDGITELWKVFYAGNKVLEKEQVECHPFAVCVPIPIPHRAIGSCPAEQVSDIQYRKSHLVRQMLDNVYLTNYPRTAYSNKVDLDDLLTPRSAGVVEVDTEVGDVAGHISPIIVPNMIEGVMSAIEYTDMEREIRTGVTRYSQGLDAESLNKTATGFKGIMDASQQRLDLIARLFAEGGVKQIFTKTIDLLAKYQDTAMHIKVLGKPIEIDPRNWGANVNCRIDVGIGAGDRQEKIINLNNILQIQERYMAGGLVLSDQVKIFNTLEKLIDEVGLKDADEYFNNPEVPEETLFAQNQQLTQMVQQMQAQLQQVNPIADAEKIRAQAKLIEAQSKKETEAEKMNNEMAKFRAEMAARLTELELKYNQDVPGSSV